METRSLSTSFCSVISGENIRKINYKAVQTSYLMDNDDEKDKDLRRKSRGRSFIINNDPSSKNIPNDMITEIYATCIKLSAENKISSKNAFGLQLIDYMQEVLQHHKEGDGTNFQVASCTLDASVKIYGYRVDSVHLDTFRMAGTLGADSNADDGGENKGDTTDSDDRTIQKRAARQIERDSRSKIETNLKNILMDKLEADEELNLWNSIFSRKPIASSFGRTGPDAFICNNYSLSSDFGHICIDPFSKPIIDEEISLKSDVIIPNSILGTISEINAESNICLQFVPDLHDFCFSGWEPVGKRKSLSSNLLPFLLKSSKEFEEDKFKDDLNFSQVRPIFHSQDIYENLSDSFDDQPDYQPINNSQTPCDAKLCNLLDPNVSLGEKRASLSKNFLETAKLSVQPGEYSYFMNALHPTSSINKDLNLYDINKLNLLSKFKMPRNTLLKPKKRKALNKKTSKEINFCEELSKEDIKNISSIRTKKISANVHKSENYSSNIIDLSKAIEDDILNTLFLITSFKLSMDIFEKLRTGITLEDIQTDEEKINAVDVPHMENGFDEGDDSYDCGDAKLSEKDELHNSFMNNLIPHPQTVNRIVVRYAKMAKRVDTKAVKTAIWKVISHGDKSKKLQKPESNRFEELYKKLPHHLSKSVSKNLTPQLAFVILLHLANEKNITLTNSPDLTSVLIDLPNNPET